jgi:MFS transporter, ACS family, hexuronate transporter
MADETKSVARAGSAAEPAAGGGRAGGYFRWVICALLLFATTKSYMDRNVLASLKNTLQPIIGWNDIDYGHIVVAFQACYALGMFFAGRLVDRLGTRLAFALAMAFWSLASMSYGFAHSVTGFLICAAALGLGQSGLFPSSLKAVAEWFPRKERSFATGVFNAGTNLGASLTPFIVVLITVRLGLSWHWAFYIVGGLGFVWLAFWLPTYRAPQDHPRLSKSELAYIKSDPMTATDKMKIPWSRLLSYRQTWAYVLGKMLTDPIWWFFLFWAPDLFQRRFGLTLAQIRIPILVIYVVSDAGSVLGGWLSSRMIVRGASENLARKTVMLGCAIAVVPVIFATRSDNFWIAVALISLATAAHQAFSANMLTLPSDMFPSGAVGSVAGIGGAAGSLGGVIIANTVGHVLQRTGSYQVPLLIAGSAYLIALGLVHLLSPGLKPVSIDSDAEA